MKSLILLFANTVKILLDLLLSAVRSKVIVLSRPMNNNLGDQAQLYCTLRIIRNEYPNQKVIVLPPCRDIYGKVSYGVIGFRSLCYAIIFLGLRLSLRRDDLLIGHSGYYFVDHHAGWATFARALIENPHVRMLILPQTVNFHAPVFARTASRIFSNRKNLALLCRDEVSYRKAQELFPGTQLKLFPDIVTSLIGEKRFSGERDGMLFCLRNDIEGLYTNEEIDALRRRFPGVRSEVTDTSVTVRRGQLDRRREELIWKKIEEFAKFQLVITDRYHGTIFAAIASTPVIVINSKDHKLSSGVNWFPKKQFDGMVVYAQNLEEAYKYAYHILLQGFSRRDNPPYFKNTFWKKGVLE